MSHRSGLVRESPIGHYFDPAEPSLAKTVASLNSTSLVYCPETKTKYSNAAVAVVGSVLESKLAVSHAQHVRDTILEPLHMSSSGFVVNETIEPRLAVGWMHTYDGRRFPAPKFLLGTGPAGNMFASMKDLASFLTCVFRDGQMSSEQRMLKPETLKQMLVPIADTRRPNAERLPAAVSSQPTGFGIGFHVKQLDGYKCVGHGARFTDSRLS